MGGARGETGPVTQASEALLNVVFSRWELLGTLTDQPQETTELTARVGSSRSTVARALRELRTHGLAEETGDGYRRTRLGRVVAEEYQQFLAQLDRLQSLGPLLGALPDTVDVPTELLVGAEVIESTPAAPYEPLEQGLARVATADHARVVLTPAVSGYLDRFREDVLTEAGRTEVGLSPGAVSWLVTERPTWFVNAVRAETVDIYELVSEPPVTVSLLSGDGTERAEMVVVEGAVTRGLVSNDTPSAAAWARDFLSERLAPATPLDPPQY